MIPVSIGLSWGNISLDEKVLSQGIYTLRGYTNWMRNFGEDYIFKKRFFIGDTSSTQWLIKLHSEVIKDEGKEKARLNLQINNLDNTPITSRTMQLKVFEGTTVLFQHVITASAGNKFDVDFSNADSVANFVDTRSTIYWEPNIITDKTGKAAVTFYAADHAGNYTVIRQGSDMNGNIGEERRKLEIRVP